VWVDGKFGKALSFDSYNDYVRATDVPLDTSAGAHNTVTFWMYWDGGNSEMPIGWSTGYDLWLYNNCFGFNTARGNIFGTSSIGLSNSWHYVTAIFYNGVPSNQTVSLYIDGVKQSLYPCVGSTTNSKSVGSTFYISGWSTGWSYKFGGIIDEVRLYNRALRFAEIYSLFNASKARLDYGDIRFTDSDGTTPLSYVLISDKEAQVTVPLVPADLDPLDPNDQKKTIYLYYGNPSASSLFSPRIFEDGFESGDSSAWDGQSVGRGTLSFPTIDPYEGDYHARFVSNNNDWSGRGRVYKYMPDEYQELYVRGYYKFDSLPSDNYQYYEFSFMNAMPGWDWTTAQVQLRKQSDTFFWRVGLKDDSGTRHYEPSSPTPSIPTPQPNRWYCIELYARVGDVNGEAKLWIDGSLEANVTGVDTDGWSHLHQAWAGSYKNGQTATKTFDYDDIVVSDSYIGCDPTPITK